MATTLDMVLGQMAQLQPMSRPTPSCTSACAKGSIEVYRCYIGLYRDNGKENGNYYKVYRV